MTPQGGLWTIIDRQSAKMCQMHAGIYRIGSSSDDDLILTSHPKGVPPCKVILDGNFCYFVEQNRTVVFYDTAEVEIGNTHLTVKNNTQTEADSPLDLSTFHKITQCDRFPDWLEMCQKEMAKVLRSAVPDPLEEKSEQTEKLLVYSIFCQEVGRDYWGDKSPEDEGARNTFSELGQVIWASICQWGLLTPLINEAKISEIMVNGYQNIYIEQQGLLERLLVSFPSHEAFLSIVERLVASTGKRLDEASPFCDARLPGGARLHLIIPPLAVDGPYLTIRKFSVHAFTAEDLLQHRTVDRRMIDLLDTLVREKRNILVSGGTSSGKTTLLSQLSSCIPAGERIVTIEDTAELRLSNQEHIVRLEGRLPNTEGRGEISIRELLRNALRMRPDRIIIGECRGGEALDMLQAMNTGHAGSMTTVHANSGIDALQRVETLAMFASSGLPSHTIRDLIAASIDIVIQMRRNPDGRRQVAEILKVGGGSSLGSGYQVEPIVTWNRATGRWDWFGEEP